MTDVRVGDKVRVTYEGEVTNVDDGNFQLAGGRYFAADPYLNRTVEVVEKRKPQVGDTIPSRTDLARLPNNSVVTNANGRPVIIRDFGTVDRHGRSDSFAGLTGNPPYLVVHVG